MGNVRYSVGAGIYDITGPAAEVNMMGYAMPYQRTKGIHTRLRSRAFVILDNESGRRVVIVSAELGMIFQAVKQKVMEKLRNIFGNLYTDANVLLSATHTHSGPGGYSHYMLYNMTSFGFEKQNFDAICEGIFQSIARAHNNVAPAVVRIAEGDLLDASMNRARLPYLQNPAEERRRYEHDTDKKMTLLRFDRPDGREAGMINWFAVHATSVGNRNRLISSDNKGYASLLFERMKKTDYADTETFTAAFAQANAGDVTPNIWGYPDGVHDFERMAVIGRRQLDKALELYDNASETLEGPIEYRHAYVDMSDVAIDPRWVGGKTGCRTGKAAIGISMLAGSTEDGKGITPLEGLRFDSVNWPKFTLSREDQELHAEKVIALPSGRMKPHPWSPEILPIQIIAIGDLVIIAVPFECTTMTGRRIRETVQGMLGNRYTVLAGVANAYTGYVATREEYALQEYEGASTHFGPYTQNAYQQEFCRLAVSIKDRTPLPPGPAPRRIAEEQMTLTPGVVYDGVPPLKRFGDVLLDANATYRRGETVKVRFWGAHLNNDLLTQKTFLKVEKKEEGGWRIVAVDGDPETRLIWDRSRVSYSKITVEWTIPEEAEPGKYRIRHFGNSKSFITRRIRRYKGSSRVFSIE